jgi:hypothetical protein
MKTPLLSLLNSLRCSEPHLPSPTRVPVIGEPPREPARSGTVSFVAPTSQRTGKRRMDTRGVPSDAGFDLGQAAGEGAEFALRGCQAGGFRVGGAAGSTRPRRRSRSARLANTRWWRFERIDGGNTPGPTTPAQRRGASVFGCGRPEPKTQGSPVVNPLHCHYLSHLAAPDDSRGSGRAAGTKGIGHALGRRLGIPQSD